MELSEDESATHADAASHVHVVWWHGVHAASRCDCDVIACARVDVSRAAPRVGHFIFLFQ